MIPAAAHHKGNGQRQLRRHGLSLPQLPQLFDRELRAQRAVLPDGRERGPDQLTHGRIVKAGNGNVVRHGDPLLRKKAHEVERVKIRDGKYGSRLPQLLQLPPVTGPARLPLHGNQKQPDRAGRGAMAEALDALPVDAGLIVRDAQQPPVAQL